jgi:hypothetical protein
MNTIKMCAVLLTSLSLLAGCADTREQYVPDVDSDINGQSPAEAPQTNLQDLFKTMKSETLATDQLAVRPDFVSNLSQDELNARTRRNSRIPVSYGEGAAGISFNTSLTEANELLDLDVGPLADGRAFYKEGMLIYWNNNQTRKPEQFILFNDYLGELPVPKKYGTVLMPTEMKNFFTEDDPKGEEMLRDFYNFYEGTAEDYDCVADGSCSAITNSELIVHILPGMILLYSRDVRKSLIQIKVFPSLAAGRLQNPFDLVQKTFHLPVADAVEAGANRIPLGLSWGEFKQRAGIDYEMFENYLDGFLQRLNGVGVFTTRSNFDRDYQIPADDEKVSSIGLSTGFTSEFVANEKPIWVVKYPETKTVEVIISENHPDSDSGVVDPGQNAEVFRLKPKMPELANDKTLQVNFVKAFNEALSEQVQQVAPPSHLDNVFSRVFGEHNRRGNRIMSGVVQQWNAEIQQSLRWNFSLEEENANFNVEVTEVSTEFRKLIMPLFGRDLDVGERELLGLSLGSVVTIEGVDLAKGEADVTVISENGDAITDRAPYLAELLFEFLEASEGSTAKNFAEVNRVSLSEGGVKLLLQPLPGSENQQVVVGITGLPYGEIKGLCGLRDFAVKVGQLDTLVSEGLKDAVEQEGVRCRYQQKMSGDSDERIVQLEFPDQGIRLNFENRALSEILTYMKREEGLRPIGGAIE